MTYVPIFFNLYITKSYSDNPLTLVKLVGLGNTKIVCPAFLEFPSNPFPHRIVGCKVLNN